MPMARDTSTAPVQALKLGASQAVSYSSSAVLSTAITTRWVRLVATTACHIKIGGSTIAATSSDALLPANTVEYLQIYPGEFVSVIRDSADGILYATEVG